MSDEINKVCFNWWVELTNPRLANSRADLARIRRANGPVEALTITAVHTLYTGLTEAYVDLRFQPERLTLLALTLAHLKTNRAEPAARQMGRGDPPKLSSMRFNHLIRATTPEELMTPMRRALKLIDNSANVGQLARDLYWWNDTTRARWCFDYYGAPSAAPDARQLSEETVI